MSAGAFRPADQHQQQKSAFRKAPAISESKDFDFHFRIVKGSAMRAW